LPDSPKHSSTPWKIFHNPFIVNQRRLILQELKIPTQRDTQELTGRTVTIFFEPYLITVCGSWYWDFASDAVFCSNVMLAFPGSFEGTQGIIHPDDVELVRKKLAPGKADRLEFRLITTYGEVKTILGESIHVQEQTPFADIVENCLQAVAKTYVEQKEFERLLLFKQVQEKVHRFNNTGIWWYNDSTNETWYSAEVFRIFDLAPFSLNAHLNTFLSFIHPDDREVVEEYRNRSYKEKTPLHIEYRIQTATGQKYVQYVSQWTFAADGAYILSGMIKDITEEKSRAKREEELEQENAFRQQQLLFDEESHTIGHWTLNLVTRKFSFSRNCHRLFGLKGKAIIEINGVYGQVHPEDLAAYKAAIKKMLLEHTAPEIDFRIYRADGKLRYMRQKAKLLSEGNELAMIGIVQDVTVEALLKKKVKELSDAEAVRSFAQGHSEEMAEMAGWVWNLTDNSIRWSENSYNLLGLKTTAKEISHKFFLSLVHPEDTAVFRDHMNVLMQQRQENSFGFRLLQWGRTRYMKASFRLLKHEEDDLFVALFRDVTKEHALEEELRQRVQLSEALSENVPDRIIITDVHNTIRVLNKACEEAYGMDKNDVIGKNFFDVFHRKKTEQETALFSRALKGERIFLRANPSVTIPGFYDLHLLPLWNNDHTEVTGIIRILHDVTHEIELERHLSERLSFIEQLVESAVDHIIALDRNMNYLVWNTKCEEYYGLKKEQVIGKNVLEIFPAVHNTPAYEHFRTVLKGETVHIPAAAEGSPFETYLSPVKNEKGDVYAILWLEHDLSREMQSKEQLEKQTRLLEAVFNASADGIILFEAVRGNDGTIEDYRVLMNNVVTQQWNGRDLTGIHYIKTFPSVKTSGLFDAYNAVMQTGEPLDTELFYEGEGFRNWFRILAVKLSEDQLVATAEDVTVRKKAEEEIRNHLTVLQNAEEMASMGSWEYEVATGRFTWSEGMFRIFGLPNNMNVQPEIYLHSAVEEDRTTAKYIVSCLRKKHQPFEEVMRIQRGHEERLLKIKASVVTDEKGKLQKIIGVDLDITEIKKAEDQLRESQYWLEQTTKASPDSITVYDLERKHPFYLNGCLASWVGLTNDNLVKMGAENRLKLVHPDDRLHLLHHNQKAAEARDGQVVTLEYRIETAAGRTIWLRNRSKPFQRDATGKVTHLLSILQNVTEEVALREELRERTRFAETILDSSTNRITVFDCNYRFMAWNKRCEQIHGLSKEKVIGRTVHEVFPGLENYPVIAEAQKRSLAGEYVHVPAIQDVFTGGYLEFFYVPLKNEDGKTYAVLNIMHDVTDYVQQAEAVNRLNKTLELKNAELEQKNEEITSFAFVASHDMKEPLRKIHTFSDWLMQEEAPQLKH
jgi:PAS domain S-box-containing protein